MGRPPAAPVRRCVRLPAGAASPAAPGAGERPPPGQGGPCAGVRPDLGPPARQKRGRPSPPRDALGPVPPLGAGRLLAFLAAGGAAPGAKLGRPAGRRGAAVPVEAPAPAGAVGAAAAGEPPPGGTVHPRGGRPAGGLGLRLDRGVPGAVGLPGRRPGAGDRPPAPGQVEVGPGDAPPPCYRGERCFKKHTRRESTPPSGDWGRRFFVGFAPGRSLFFSMAAREFFTTLLCQKVV